MTDSSDTPAVQESPDPFGAYPRLSPEQIAALESAGERHQVETGAVLYREGQGTGDFFVILHGHVAVVEQSPAGEQLIGLHGPGRFLGELGLLTDEAVFVSAIVRETGEVLVVRRAVLREIVTRDPVLGDLILHALIVRRTMLVGIGAGLRIIGSRYSNDTRRLRDFAGRNRLPHQWIDLDSDPGAEDILRRLGIAPAQCPVVIVGPDHVLRNPSNADLARAVGLRPPVQLEAPFDLIVVGGGPAGLAAAVYGASEGLSTIVVESLATGGQAERSPRIENYLGFPAGVSGDELAERATIQAKKFGAQISVPAEAVSLAAQDGAFHVGLTGGESLVGRSVVIAGGVRYRRLPVPGLSRLEGACVYYAATPIEARLCQGDPVVAVGGGNSAAQGVLLLARYVPRLSLVIREQSLGENMSRYLADRIARTASIDVLVHREVRELVGERELEAVIVQDTSTGGRERLDARALFVFIGAEPHTDWLRGRLALDSGGYILTGADAATVDPGRDGRVPRLLESSLSGVFAAGDIRSGSTPRVAAAVGDGALAIRHVHHYLDGRLDVVCRTQVYLGGRQPIPQRL